MSIVHTWDEPPRSETNAIVLPSGDQRGAVSEARALVSRRGSPPSIGTIQRFVKFLFASASYTRRVNTTRPPSGEGCGDASRSIAIMSRTEKGCLASSARAGTAAQVKTQASKMGTGVLMAVLLLESNPCVEAGSFYRRPEVVSSSPMRPPPARVPTYNESAPRR